MSNLRTVASILACSLSLLTAFLIFPETASGYLYSAYVAALIDQYKQGKEMAASDSLYESSIGTGMQIQSMRQINEFLDRVNQAVRKNPSRSDCEEGRSYYNQLMRNRDIMSAMSASVSGQYNVFNRFC